MAENISNSTSTTGAAGCLQIAPPHFPCRVQGKVRRAISVATLRRCAFTSMAKTFARATGLATAIENRPIAPSRLQPRSARRWARPAPYAQRFPADQAARRIFVWGWREESFQMLVSG